MKTATLLIYEPFRAGGLICVAIIYRRNQLVDFLGYKADLPSLLEKAYTYTQNQKFTHLKVNGKKYSFADYLKGLTP